MKSVLSTLCAFRDRCLFRSVLFNASLHQFAHERGWQRTVYRKTKRTLAGIVRLKFFLVDLQRVTTRVEGAMIRPRRKGHQHSAVKTKAWHLVTNAFLGFRRRR